MSLVRLLTSGKSLVGLGEPSTRYRMRSGYLLPKFGGDKNPFSDPDAPKAVPAMTETGTAAPAKYQLTPAELAAARLKETKRLPAVAIAAMQAADAQMAEVRLAMASRFKEQALELADKAVRAPIGWTKRLLPKLAKLNPLAWRYRWKGKAKPAIPPFGKTTIQGELSLDNIKVVRNDLNESDVEVVPARTVVNRKSAATESVETGDAVEATPELIKT